MTPDSFFWLHRVLLLHAGFSLIVASGGYSLVAVHGFLTAMGFSWGAWVLGIQALLAVVCKLESKGAVVVALGSAVPWQVEPSQVRDWIHVPCISKHILGQYRPPGKHHRYLFEVQFSFILDIPTAGINESYNTSIFNFWKTSILFALGAEPAYSPCNSAQGFPFLHILTKTCSLFLMTAILTDVTPSLFLLSLMAFHSQPHCWG